MDQEEEEAILMAVRKTKKFTIETTYSVGRGRNTRNFASKAAAMKLARKRGLKRIKFVETKQRRR